MSGKLQFATYGFSGGYNPSADPTEVKDEQCTYGKNWIFKVASDRNRVSIVKRPGATFIGSTSGYGVGGSSSASNDSVTHQSVYRQIDGSEWIISIIGNSTDAVINAYNGTATSSVATNHVDFRGTKFDSENYQNKLYIISNAGKYLEISYSSPTWTVNKLTPTGTDGNSFKGTIIKEFEERMYIAGDPTYPYRLYISVVGDPTDFSGTGAGYINFQSEITGIGTAESYLVVHTKNHGIHKIYFDISGNPSRTHVPNSKGTVAHATIAEIDNAQVYLADDGVYRLGYEANYPEDIRSSRISDDIQTEIDDITDKSACSSLYYNDCYYLTYRNDSDSTFTWNDHVIMYNFTVRAWSAPWETADGLRPNKGMAGTDYIYKYDDTIYTCSKLLAPLQPSPILISKVFKWTDGTYKDVGCSGETVNGEYDEFGSIDLIYRTKSTHHDIYDLLKYWYTTTIKYLNINDGHPTVTVVADDKSNEQIERDLSNMLSASSVPFSLPYLGGNVLGFSPLGGAGYVDLYTSDYMDIRTGTPVIGSFAYVQFEHSQIDRSIELLSFSLEFRAKPRKVRAIAKIY